VLREVRVDNPPRPSLGALLPGSARDDLLYDEGHDGKEGEEDGGAKGSLRVVLLRTRRLRSRMEGQARECRAHLCQKRS